MDVMNEVEVKARYEIEIEEYTLSIQIESRVLGDIARNHVIPTAIRYQNTLIENVRGLKEIYGTDFRKVAKEQMDILEQISDHIAHINKGVTDMVNERKRINKFKDANKRATAYSQVIIPFFEQIRYHSDKLELLVDDEQWSLTKYRELLYAK